MKKLLVIFGILIVAGVGIGLYRNAHRPQQTVIVYSSISKDFLKEVHRIFEAQHPGIKVQTILSTTTVLEDRIRSERAGPLGDVMFGGDVTTYLQLKKHGLIQAVELSMTEALPAHMKDPGKTWYAVYELPGVILYNDQLIPADQVPKDWGDLIDPARKGDVAIRNPTQSGVARAFVLALVKAWGENRAFDYFRKLNAQMEGRYLASNDKLLMDLVRGDIKISVLNEADVWMVRHKKKYPLAVAYPASGAFVMPEPMAMIAGAPHPEAAKLYMEFMLGLPAQEFAAVEYYRRPSRSDFPRDKLPPEIRDPVKALPVDWLSIGDQGTLWLQKWNEEVWHKGGS